MKNIIKITLCLLMLGGGLSSCNKTVDPPPVDGIWLYFIGWKAESGARFTIIRAEHDDHSIVIDTIRSAYIKPNYPYILNFYDLRNYDYLIYADSSRVNIIGGIKVADTGNSYLFNGERRTDRELKIYK